MKKYNLTEDHILVYTISNHLNQWLMEKGGEFVLGYAMGVDRCAAMNEIIWQALPEARRIIRENKHRLVGEKDEKQE